MREQSLEFLRSIVETPSPSGFEQQVARLYRSYVEPCCHRLTTDLMGNVTAVINPDAPMRFMLAGHMDEIGFIVHHIDEDGFLFFSTIGGIDGCHRDRPEGLGPWVRRKDRASDRTQGDPSLQGGR
jgi:putative aminopeptidase FrvX